MATLIQVNCAPYGSHTVSGNWNNVIGNPNTIGVKFADMIDDTNVATGIALEVTQIPPAEGWAQDTLAESTTNFPSPAYQGWWNSYSNSTPPFEKMIFKLSGFSAGQSIQVTWALKYKSGDNDNRLTLVGATSPTADVSPVSANEEYVMNVDADGSGIVYLEAGQYTDSVSSALAGFLIDY